MRSFAESVVEGAALAWLEDLGWQVTHGPDIAPGGLAAERSGYCEVVLAQRRRDEMLLNLISGEVRVNREKCYVTME